MVHDVIHLLKRTILGRSDERRDDGRADHIGFLRLFFELSPLRYGLRSYLNYTKVYLNEILTTSKLGGPMLTLCPTFRRTLPFRETKLAMFFVLDALTFNPVTSAAYLIYMKLCFSV